MDFKEKENLVDSKSLMKVWNIDLITTYWRAQ